MDCIISPAVVKFWWINALFSAKAVRRIFMKVYSVFDPEFKPYGQIVTGLDETVKEILEL